jgi:hypothetical protein
MTERFPFSVVPANAKIVGLVGEPPKRFRISEWESLDKLQGYYNSPESQALNDMPLP